mgnify:FL=1
MQRKPAYMQIVCRRMIFHLAANGKCFSAELFEVVLVTVLERAKNACAIGFYSVSWSYLVNSHVRKHPAKSQWFPVGAYATFDPGVQSPSFRSVLFPNAFVSFPFVSIPFRENRLFSVRAGGTCQWAILVREVLTDCQSDVWAVHLVQKM